MSVISAFYDIECHRNMGRSAWRGPPETIVEHAVTIRHMQFSVGRAKT
jgi:hypothetical protein